jgi:hypothetical protein
MSDMLEQAIIDADALREAATKNAETLVLEKYSNQIKEAVETLLEQDELEAGLEGDLGIPPEPGASPEDVDPTMGPLPSPSEQSSVMEHIPLAVTSDGSEEIEIPLDKLFEEITNLSEAMRFNGDEVYDEDIYEHNLDEFNESLYEDDYLEEDLIEEDLIEEDGWDAGASPMKWPHGYPGTGDDFPHGATIGENLVVDVGPLVKSGWAGIPESQLQIAEEELLALEQDSKVREEKEAQRKAVRELNAVNENITNQNKKLTSTLNKSSKYMTKLRDTVLVLEEKLEKASLVNIKLLYQNKALNSSSLNERQKEKLVESVSNAETIEEAKVIFETLQNTVGSTSRNSQPNSLSEAIQKTSSMILSSRKENSAEQKNNPTLDRWKFLAGIDKQ